MRYEAHPDAAIFPMMSPDELADLAEDIKENGLKHPIVLGIHDGAEVIVDGRNRQDACEIAMVTPEFAKINGEDVKDFIISQNVKRRHLNSGQRAMAYALMYPPGGAGRGKSLKIYNELGHAAPTFKVLVSHARTVLRDSRALAEEVMSGAKFLDTAYQIAKAKLDANRGEEEKRQRVALKAPDLYQLLQDSRMTLDDALAALSERERKAKQISEQGQRAAQELGNLVSYAASIAMAYQQGERDMIDAKKFPAVVEAVNQLVKLHKEGA